MGGPRQPAQVATGRMWAAASARSLARRLRRQARTQAETYIADLGARLQHLRSSLCAHACLEGRTGRHYHHLGEAIACAKAMGVLSGAELRDARAAKELGDLARHVPFSADPAVLRPKIRQTAHSQAGAGGTVATHCCLDTEDLLDYECAYFPITISDDNSVIDFDENPITADFCESGDGVLDVVLDESGLVGPGCVERQSAACSFFSCTSSPTVNGHSLTADPIEMDAQTQVRANALQWRRGRNAVLRVSSLWAGTSHTAVVQELDRCADQLPSTCGIHGQLAQG